MAVHFSSSTFFWTILQSFPSGFICIMIMLLSKKPDLFFLNIVSTERLWILSKFASELWVVQLSKPAPTSCHPVVYTLAVPEFPP